MHKIIDRENDDYILYFIKYEEFLNNILYLKINESDFIIEPDFDVLNYEQIIEIYSNYDDFFLKKLPADIKNKDDIIYFFDILKTINDVLNVSCFD